MDQHKKPTEREHKAAARDWKRDAALRRYDAHPGLAVAILAVMAFLFIVIVYQWMSEVVSSSSKQAALEPELSHQHR